MYRILHVNVPPRQIPHPYNIPDPSRGYPSQSPFGTAAAHTPDNFCSWRSSAGSCNNRKWEEDSPSPQPPAPPAKAPDVPF